MTVEKLTEVRNAVKILVELSNEEWEEVSQKIQLEKNDVKILAIRSKEYFEKVTNILEELGVSPNIKGYHYLRSAIIYYINAEDPSKIGITKHIYPSVAKEFATTPQCVERAIRHAIENMCEKENNPKIYELFGFLKYYRKGKPSNGKVIAVIAEYLKMH